MNIALFHNMQKPKTKTIAIGIKEFLIARGVKVFAENYQELGENVSPLSEVEHKDIDFLISLGGDGTILRLFHEYPDFEAPVLGINLGGLGFMADITVEELYPSLTSLLKGEYSIQSCMMIEGKTDDGRSGFAINEIVVHRDQNACLIDLNLHVNGNYLNTFAADGIIIATSTGSTAYSLAAGGPILMPELEAVVVTPICPHTISNRPIVLTPEREIRIQYVSDHGPIKVFFDGCEHFLINSGEMFYITRSQRTFKVAMMSNYDYFRTLRTKLGWAGRLKSGSYS